MARRTATGLTGPVILAMLGGLLIFMAVLKSPVLWPSLLGGVAFLLAGLVLYARQGRDRQVARFARGATAGEPAFSIALRGYHVGDVDELVTRAQDAVTRPAARRRKVREDLAAARPRRALRGYAVPEVDAYLRRMVDHLADPAS